MWVRARRQLADADITHVIHREMHRLRLPIDLLEYQLFSPTKQYIGFDRYANIRIKIAHLKDDETDIY